MNAVARRCGAPSSPPWLRHRISRKARSAGQFGQREAMWVGLDVIWRCRRTCGRCRRASAEREARLDGGVRVLEHGTAQPLAIAERSPICAVSAGGSARVPKQPTKTSWCSPQYRRTQAARDRPRACRSTLKVRSTDCAPARRRARDCTGRRTPYWRRPRPWPARVRAIATQQADCRLRPERAEGGVRMHRHGGKWKCLRAAPDDFVAEGQRVQHLQDVSAGRLGFRQSAGRM